MSNADQPWWQTYLAIDCLLRAGADAGLGIPQQQLHCPHSRYFFCRDARYNDWPLGSKHGLSIKCYDNVDLDEPHHQFLGQELPTPALTHSNSLLSKVKRGLYVSFWFACLFRKNESIWEGKESLRLVVIWLHTLV